MRRICLIVVGLLLTGCSAAAEPQSSDVTTTTSAPAAPRPLPVPTVTAAPPETSVPPAEIAVEQLEPLLLQLGDLPQGWGEEPAEDEPASGGVPSCLAAVSEQHRQDPASFTPPAGQGPTFSSPDKEVFVTSAIASYGSDSTALIDFQTVIRDDVRQCLLQEFVAALESNPSFAAYEVVDSDVRTLDGLTPETDTHTVVYTATLASGGSTLVVSNASAVALRGSLVASVNVIGFGQFDTSFFGPAFSALVERVGRFR